ncbi:MAG TPA: hypothetical protein VL307_10435, partial [Chitinophagaceae bacterium]|nr:hypothetical protein [Chitinophagaceae bacterium]
VRFNPAKQWRTASPPAGSEEDYQPAAFSAFTALPVAGRVPWSSCGYYLSARPAFTFDPLLHAGCYYVQEASSMFVEQALRQTSDLRKALRVLDLCAAPGGKSTLLQSLISKDSLLVSNDVIKSRAAILEENIIKWGASNVVVTNNDPAHFARLQDYFDVIVVDAPCSGSGLFRKDAEAISEWSENNVALCSQRQQRILADVWPALKPGGILIYATCSYSPAEDEAIIDWLLSTHEAGTLPLQLQEDWMITTSFTAQHKASTYRFFPGKTMGEGFFLAVLQKNEAAASTAPRWPKTGLEKVSAKAEKACLPLIDASQPMLLFHQKEAIVALPSIFEKDILLLQSALYIKKAGVVLGTLAGNTLLPDHQLALSTLAGENIPRISLNVEQAIQYLRKQEFTIDTPHRGWARVTYHGYALGWIKMLEKRFNNYYPKEWRILKAPA